MNATTHDVSDFRTDVIERSRTTPVLVDFWAAWCGPCRALGPVLERLAAGADGRWTLAKLDTEAYPDVAAQYDIQGIPNVKLFVNGEVVDEFVGALPEREILAWLDRAIPSPASAATRDARALLAAGDIETAATAFAALLAADPANAGARLALAELALRTNPASVEALLGPLGDDHADRVEALRVLAHWLLQGDALPEGAAREAFSGALESVRTGDWDGALEHIVASLRAQRGYAGGAAREFGRAIYLLLGIEHPACERHYRGFTSALYV